MLDVLLYGSSSNELAPMLFFSRVLKNIFCLSLLIPFIIGLNSIIWIIYQNMVRFRHVYIFMNRSSSWWMDEQSMCIFSSSAFNYKQHSEVVPIRLPSKVVYGCG